MDNLPLQRVSHKRLFEQVVDQLIALIQQGILEPGDRLPSERHLQKQLGVSRNGVRAAIRTLEALGLVETRQGAGSYVRRNDLNGLPETLSGLVAAKRQNLSEILMARKIFEPNIAYFAALNAKEDDIAELEEILDQHEKKAAVSDPGVAEDANFHYTIAKMTGNRVVLTVMDAIMDLIRESREFLLQYPNTAMRSGHRQIVAALAARDPEAAKEAMLRHIEEVEAAYQEVFQATAQDGDLSDA